MLWTQPTANLGNFLYDWMHAWTWRRRGLDLVCLRTPATEPWVPLFGTAAEELLLPRDSVRLWDRREKGLYNEFGSSFSTSELDDFIKGFVVPSGIIDLARVPEHRRLGENDVLVNVRRGDYYSDEKHRRSYAFDTDEYLTEALRASLDHGPIERIQIVSDGIDWCIQHLGWLREHCQRLEFVDESLPPQTHWAMLANAPRLILTNSTFSYWGGYLSAWRTGRPEWVVAPSFHCRTDAEGPAWQLDPRWTVITDIPSNWALPDAS